ncbi:unnamed protein product [Cuscuta europaea]|uniref:Protein FAR1-RELATED SEQUENCE n=1 Tax=Cuscuta europaea TaxID=41803 RepID=A0A9P0YTH5_CUSEU|nr:unnamed protein product [Cuscuta europaea]
MNLEEAIAFYKKYASVCGFAIRLGSQSKARDGTILLKYVVCNREGFKNDSNSSKNDCNASFIQSSNDNSYFVCSAPTISTNCQSSEIGDASTINGDEVKKIIRRRVSSRIGCNARVCYKYCGLRGYVVYSFEERHNHCMTSESSKKFLKVNRNLDIGHQKFVINCAKANIGTSKSYRLFKGFVGGYSNIGATAVDFKNFKRDLKAYIEGVDAHMLIDKLFRKQELCSAFIFDYDVDETDKLTRLFWCDPIARENYSCFGDVISFDATYGTNRCNKVFTPFTGVDNHKKCITYDAGLLSKEDVDSYVWIFMRFLNAMHREPNCIVTDQDPAMQIAIEKVFSHARHRYCMWHIMKMVTSKVGPVLSHNEEFMSRINSVVRTNFFGAN